MTIVHSLHPSIRPHILHGTLDSHGQFKLFPGYVTSLHRRQVRMAWRLRWSSRITRHRLVAVRPTDGSCVETRSN